MSDAPQTTPKSMIERQLGPEDVGARGFLVWLKASMPALYRGIESDLKKLNKEASLSGLGQFPSFGEQQTTSVPAGSAPASTSWTDAVSKLVQAYGQYKLTDAQLDTVRKITDANLARAQQGLKPLPYDAAQLGLAPTVNFGLSGDTSRLLVWGGLGFLGLMALGALKPKRS